MTALATVGRASAFLRRGALVLALSLAGAGAAAAQQPAASPDTAKEEAPKTPRERIMTKLRALDARRDTTTDSTRVAADSTRPAATPSPVADEDGVPVPQQTQAASVSIPQDSIMTALSQLEGFVATEYQGKSAHFATDTGQLVLKGPAAVVQGGQAMTADSMLVYNQNSSIACGYGKPVLSGAGQNSPVQSDQICYDVGTRMGVALGAKTTFDEGAKWFVHGEKVYTSGTEQMFAKDASFTDCDLEIPHYHFNASEVKVIRGDVLVARNVTLNFADVPVFWLPFMFQSMKQGRRSGLLAPKFDLNDIARTNAGYHRRLQDIGFYWAVNDNLGALLSADWFSGNYTALNGAFDYNFARQFLRGGLSVKQYWQSDGGTQLTLSTTNSWQPDERTHIDVSGNYASSSQFVAQQSFDPLELNRSIDTNAGISRRFDWGSVNLSASRRQFITDDRVTWTLPSFGLNLQPVTFFRSAAGEPKWYNNGTWNGSLSVNATRDDNNDFVGHPTAFNNRGLQGNFNSSFNLGNFSWSQTMQYDHDLRVARDSLIGNPANPDTVLVVGAPSRVNDHLTWSTSLNYTQRLIGTSTFTPHLALNGQSVRDDSLSSQLVAAPMRLDFGASLQTNVFGFWPGVGPFSAIRHRLSPSIGYSYSPAPDPASITPLQQQIYGSSIVSGLREKNQITLSLSQTFEAKYKESEKPDTASADSVSADSTGTGMGGDVFGSSGNEPTRKPQARKMTLLSLNTSIPAYDFTQDTLRHRRVGFVGNQITNSITSDLVRGLSVSLTHDIFRNVPSADASAPPDREFHLHLSQVNASFSLNDHSGLLKALGLSRGKQAPEKPVAEADSTTAGGQLTSPLEDRGAGLGIIPRTPGTSAHVSNAAVGSWNASFSYSLFRPEPILSVDPTTGATRVTNPPGSQMLQANVSFQPTDHWSVQWRTGYSFTDGRFSDHALDIVRDLHDWEAHFTFYKAQNGNFTFQFRVNLRADPDLKFDYAQRGGDAFQNSFGNQQLP